MVDLRKRDFIAEIETPGCSLIYPTGNRRFFSLCGDGSLLDIVIDDNGKVVSAGRSAKFFDPETDPISEKGVRLKNTWYFVSFEGYLHKINFGETNLDFAKPWSLIPYSERQQGWRIGGTKHLTVHKSRGLLYSIVHQGGGQETRKDPGKAIWVYDLAARKRNRYCYPQTSNRFNRNHPGRRTITIHRRRGAECDRCVRCREREIFAQRRTNRLHPNRP